MNKVILAIVFLSLILLGIYFRGSWISKSPAPARSSSVMSETEITASTKTEKPNQTIAPHHTDHSKIQEVLGDPTKKD